ncbi:hypothetical protein OIU84_026958 [Salix udensis]|uniref:Uncharacterized protein n=1 Tax=Salix udensis TaxID=889485 RepID=A0AAD6KE86_9ROSI|nr:hypothetical protein OIU84_026958 [Salix udensis]
MSIGKEFFQSGSQRMQSVEDDSSVRFPKEAARVSASSKQKRSFSGNFSSDDFNNPALVCNPNCESRLRYCMEANVQSL